MSDYLKLTAYFGERQRGERGFVADELLDLCGSHAVATSVALRGIAGFGPHHELRSDLSLSSSEDLPMTVVAVDTAELITGLADRTAAMLTRGIVTLERAQRVRVDDPGTGKLTIYIGRHTRVGGRPGYRAICDLLHQHGFAGATAFLGVDGTERGRRRRARFFAANTAVPVMIVGIASNEQVAAALPQLRQAAPEATMTLERIQLCKRDGRLLARPTALPATDGTGVPLWQKVMIHTSEATRHDGIPVHRSIVDHLLAQQACSGATVLRGIWGFHGDHDPHGDKLFQLGREVPVTTIVVDSPERIADCFAIIDGLTAEHGLVTSELVPALVSIDGGRRRGNTELARYTW